MKQKRILSVQDLSCLGKCSNSVALPILSAAGVETLVVPTALLSTHTGGFTGNTFLDLTEEMEGILAHFATLELQADMLYTGYLASSAQMALIGRYMPAILAPGALCMIDPVMGDRGQLYSIYDGAFVSAMRDFCGTADLITPNVTEACYLAGVPYRGDAYERSYIDAILDGLSRIGCRAAALTGVLFGEEQIGVVYASFATGERFTVAAERSPSPLHGSGDVFASALAGYLLNGFSIREALTETLSFLTAAVRATEPVLETHWYGLRFEDALPRITETVERKKARGRTAEEIREGL